MNENIEFSPEMMAELKSHAEANTPFTEAELDTIADLALDCIKHVLSFFNIYNATVDEYEDADGGLVLDIKGDDLSVLIGRHGKTLDALQTLISAMCTSKLGFFYPVMVDVGSYRSRRKEKLQNLAHASAARAVRKGMSVKLTPMSPAERRLVHLALSDDPRVTTHSEGEEPYRYVIVTALGRGDKNI